MQRKFTYISAVFLMAILFFMVNLEREIGQEIFLFAFILLATLIPVRYLIQIVIDKKRKVQITEEEISVRRRQAEKYFNYGVISSFVSALSLLIFSSGGGFGALILLTLAVVVCLSLLIPGIIFPSVYLLQSFSKKTVLFIFLGFFCIQIISLICLNSFIHSTCSRLDTTSLETLALYNNNSPCKK